jgi:hypothetical protein
MPPRKIRDIYVCPEKIREKSGSGGNKAVLFTDRESH